MAARKEARKQNARVDDITDAWIFCGSPRGHEHTWDTTMNTNSGMQFASRCRFDRCLFLSPGTAHRAHGPPGSPPSAAQPACEGRTGAAWRPVAFELVGRAKVPNLSRFPSDHWGMQVVWASEGLFADSSPAEGDRRADAPPAAGGPDAQGDRQRRGNPVAARAKAVAQDGIQSRESPKAVADSQHEDGSIRGRHGRDAVPAVCGLRQPDRALLRLLLGEG